MHPKDRPSRPESGKGFWIFAAWSLFCAAALFYKVRPHPLQTFQFLALSFQGLNGSWAQGARIWLDHLAFFLSFVAALSVLLGTGERMLRWLAERSLSSLESWVWSLALGLVFWGTLAEGLAFENLLYPGLLKAIFLTATAALLVRDRGRALARCWPFRGSSDLPLFWKGAIGTAVFLSLCNLLAPEMSWDAMTYQLILPQFYFKAHGFYPVTGIGPSQYPSLGQMFFSWGLLWGNDSLARSFCFLAHLGTALALSCFGTRLGHPKAGSWGALFYWLFPYFNLYSTRGYVDLFTGFFATLGLGSLAVWAAHSGKNGEKREEGEGIGPDLTGILCLAAVWGIKYNAVSYWLSGAVLLAWAALRGRVKTVHWVWLVAGPLVFFGPWALKSLLYVGDPFYPHLSSWFHTFGLNDFDQKASALKFRAEGWRGLLKVPLMPWTVFLENYSGAPNEETSLIPWVAAPLLFLRGSKGGWKAPILAAAVIPFLCWAVTSHQLRLISAVFALAALFWGGGLEAAVELWPAYRRAMMAIFGFFLWAAVYYLFQGLVQQPNPFPNFFGLQSRESFLETVLRPEGYVQMTQELGRQLPLDARVLILGQQNGYYLDRISAYDFDYTYPVLKGLSEASNTPEELFRKLKERGFTHILYNYNGMRGSAIRAGEMGLERYPWNPPELALYEKFFLKYTRKIPLKVGKGYSLYELGPRAGFSALPENLPGTELYYLRNVQELMNLKKPSDLIGRNIPTDIYIASYERTAEQNPGFGYPCFQWAFAVLSLHPELASKALKIADRGYAVNGDEASWLDLHGSAALIRKQFPKAVNLLEGAQRLSPERVDTPGNLAVAYYNERNFPKALEEVRKAESLDPSSAEYPDLERQLRALLAPH